jgi:predicted MFS family arabinose efflux permease
MRARLLPLSFGNFIIGSGGFIVAGLLNELTADLHVPVQVAGQLLSGYSLALAFGAPLLAWLTSRIERRVLLASALLIYALLHFAAALAPGYGVLMLLRVLTGAAAAIITPQAVATAGLMVPAHERGSAIGAVFLGFSISTVLGVPLGSLLGSHFGWRAAFAVIGLLSLAGTAWVWLVIPRGLHVAPMDGKAWKQLGSNPVVLLVVGTTVVHGTGQFVLYSYLAPVLKESLAASPQLVSMMFLWLGAAGVTGNMIGGRVIDKMGAPRVVLTSLCFGHLPGPGLRRGDRRRADCLAGVCAAQLGGRGAGGRRDCDGAAYRARCRAPLRRACGRRCRFMRRRGMRVHIHQGAPFQRAQLTMVRRSSGPSAKACC